MTALKLIFITSVVLLASLILQVASTTSSMTTWAAVNIILCFAVAFVTFLFRNHVKFYTGVLLVEMASHLNSCCDQEPVHFEPIRERLAELVRRLNFICPVNKIDAPTYHVNDQYSNHHTFLCSALTVFYRYCDELKLNIPCKLMTENIGLINFATDSIEDVPDPKQKPYEIHPTRIYIPEHSSQEMTDQIKGIIWCSTAERYQIYETFKKDFTRVIASGYLVKVATFGSDTICVAWTSAQINNNWVLLVEDTSEVVHHGALRDWAKQTFPNLLEHPQNAENAHVVINRLKE